MTFRRLEAPIRHAYDAGGRTPFFSSHHHHHHHHLLLLLVAALVFFPVPIVTATEVATPAGQPPVPAVTTERPMSFWMSMKLEYSKRMLEALTAGNFTEMTKTAQQMRLLSKLEGFVRNRNPDYAEQMHAFDLANKQMIRQSRRGNIDGATLAFQQLTSSCVACHVSLREPPSEPPSEPE